MKLQLALCGLLALSLASCDSNTNTTTATSTDTLNTTTDPNMVTTTTTTTTTRATFVPKPNVQYMDLRTKKMVTVRVDTVHHYIVNTQTNQPVEWILEPGTTDTIYGPSMSLANGYILYNGNDWSYDQSAASSTSSTDMNSANMNTGTTDASGSDVNKMKSNGNETKVKMNDGSKVKSNANETKVKNK
jgi:hypothetical protein